MDWVLLCSFVEICPCIVCLLARIVSRTTGVRLRYFDSYGLYEFLFSQLESRGGVFLASVVLRIVVWSVSVSKGIRHLLGAP